jgi:hypothetical protein
MGVSTPEVLLYFAVTFKMIGAENIRHCIRAIVGVFWNGMTALLGAGWELLCGIVSKGQEWASSSLGNFFTWIGILFKSLLFGIGNGIKGTPAAIRDYRYGEIPVLTDPQIEDLETDFLQLAILSRSLQRNNETPTPRENYLMLVLRTMVDMPERLSGKSSFNLLDVVNILEDLISDPASAIVPKSLRSKLEELKAKITRRIGRGNTSRKGKFRRELTLYAHADLSFNPRRY